MLRTLVRMTLLLSIEVKIILGSSLMLNLLNILIDYQWVALTLCLVREKRQMNE